MSLPVGFLLTFRYGVLHFIIEKDVLSPLGCAGGLIFCPSSNGIKSPTTVAVGAKMAIVIRT